MLARVDSHELSEWLAFDRLEPIDHAHRAEASNARLMALIASLVRKKGDPSVDWQDLMPRYGEEKRQQTWDEQLAMFEGLAAMWGDKK